MDEIILDNIEAKVFAELESILGKRMEKLSLAIRSHFPLRCGVSIYMEKIYNLIIRNEILPCLPKSMGDLKYIREIEIVGSEIKIVPNSIGNLKLLKKLYLIT